MVARGVVADVAEAFDRYLSSGRPAYVPARALTDAVAIAAKAGGVAVLAHPGRLADGERDRVVGEALEAGVDGIEVGTQHDDGLRRSLAGLAERRACWPSAVRLPRPASRTCASENGKARQRDRPRGR